jgi:5'(3')-deoxyribonucleotidase
MTRCFLDVDGVLADFVGGIHRKLWVDFDVHQWPYVKGPAGWHFHDELGITFMGLSRLCDFDFWRNLYWMHDGHDILRVVLEFFDPTQITLLTAPMPNIMSASGKIAWVKQHLPEYERRIGVWTDSKAILAQVPGSILIDDGSHNIRDWRAAGGDAVLVPRPWNELHDWSETAVSWVYDELSRHDSEMPGPKDEYETEEGK